MTGNPVMNQDLVLQSPLNSGGPLFLLHHGVGMGPESMGRLGIKLRDAFPSAWVVAVAAPHPADGGQGRQWYSSSALNTEVRRQRVAAVLQEFVASVRHWQQRTGTDAVATALVGFSQGAVMSLEAAAATPGLVGRVVSFGGRFAELPQATLTPTSVHLIHGMGDRVVPSTHSVQAAERLLALGTDVTLDLQAELGHTFDDGAISSALRRLQYHGS